jgi:hypothetical protein
MCVLDCLYDLERTRELGRPIRMNRVRALAWIVEVQAESIVKACGMAQAYFDQPLPKVPGATMSIRMAERLGNGMSAEQAAAREYVYRWSLALTPSPRNAGLFGVPHTLGL